MKFFLLFLFLFPFFASAKTYELYLDGTGSPPSRTLIPFTVTTSGQIPMYDGTTLIGTTPLISHVSGLQAALDAKVSAGSAVVYHVDGTQTSYLPSANTDTARGTMVRTAVNAAVTSGDLVSVFPGGTFALGAFRLALHDGVNLYLAPGVKITSTADLFSDGCVIYPGEGSVISGYGAKVTCIAAGGSGYQACVGEVLDNGETGRTAFSVYGLTCEGSDSDSIYVQGTIICHVILRDVNLSSKWDTCTISSNGVTPAAHLVEVYNASVTIPGGSFGTQSRAFCAGDGATIKVYGANVSISNAGILGAYCANTVRSSTIELYGVVSRVSNGVNPAFDLLNTSGTIKVGDGSGSGTNGLWTNSGAFSYVGGDFSTARLPAFTGDITTTAGAVATTLANVNGNVGTFGSAMVFPAITVNAKGLVTAVSTTTVKADQIQSASYAVDSGSTDAYAATLSPAISAYVAGTVYRIKCNTVNTGACTLNLNALGPKNIKKPGASGGVDPNDNDIRAGQIVDFVYDSVSNAMFMQSAVGNSSGGGGGGDMLAFNNLSDVANAATAAHNLGLGTADTPQFTGIKISGLTGILQSNGSSAATVAKANEIESALFAVDSGSTDTYVATLSPAITSYVSGNRYWFRANTANTGAATINFNGLGAKTIKKGSSSDLEDNDIRAGQWVDVVYDSAGDNMQMKSLPGKILYATGDNLGTPSAGVAINFTSFPGELGKLGVHGADIASATTTNLESATGELVDVTGTTPITAFTLSDGHKRIVRFTGICPITYNASTLILPASQSYITQVGDYMTIIGYASSVVRVSDIRRADGTPVAVGTLVAGTNAGAITAFDMPVTGAAAAATEESFGISLDGTNIFKVYAESDGAGGIQKAQIKMLGTPTNDSAATGYVGEYVSSSVVIGSATSLTTATAKNVTTISLTAGDWDVGGMVSFTEGSSTVTARVAGISTTTGTLPTDGTEGYCGVQSTVTSETNSIPLTRQRLSISATTTVYLVGKATFSAGTAAGFGTINARRIR